MFLAAREELYDTSADPREFRDRALENPPALAAARRSLKEDLVHLAADAERIVAPVEPMAPLSEDEKAGLRALGYLR
jgi:hypothetical protein